MVRMIAGIEIVAVMKIQHKYFRFITKIIMLIRLVCAKEMAKKFRPISIEYKYIKIKKLWK